MSTPISNIPINQQPTKIEEDPEVTAILQDLQPPVQRNTGPQGPPQSVPQQKHVHFQDQHPNNYVIHEQFQQNRYIDFEVLKKSLIIAVIVYVIFYPELFNVLYEKFQILEHLKIHDFSVRAVVLVVVLYLLIWKFNE